MRESWDFLYAFTQECFVVELKIWPLRQYEELENVDQTMRKEKPGAEKGHSCLAGLRGEPHRPPCGS